MAVQPGDAVVQLLRGELLDLELLARNFEPSTEQKPQLTAPASRSLKAWKTSLSEEAWPLRKSDTVRKSGVTPDTSHMASTSVRHAAASLLEERTPLR